MIETIDVTVQCPKETRELASAVCKLIEAFQLALKDGFQVGQDIPAIVVVAIAELPKAIDGIEKLDDEFKHDPIAMAQTFALLGFDVAKLFVKK